MKNLNHKVHCCADCGGVAEGGVSLKACKSCMSVKYCNVNCQKNHWPTHKKVCKQRAAELCDEVLFKDPLPKDDCPICFLPMPERLLSCMTLPPATISSVPIADFAEANEELADMSMETYYSCCGKSICVGCINSFGKTRNIGTCPFCKADHVNKTDGEGVEEFIKRVEVNDAGSMYVLGNHYCQGQLGLLRDRERAMELWTRAAVLGSSQAHFHLGVYYREGGDLKKAKFHTEAAAMAGHEVARCNLGMIEVQSGNMGRAVKHWTIAASTGNHAAMKNILVNFKQGHGVSRDALNSTLTAYNNYCAEMRSEARDAAIRSY